jgi:hypothetical protein
VLAPPVVPPLAPPVVAPVPPLPPPVPPFPPRWDVGGAGAAGGFGAGAEVPPPVLGVVGVVGGGVVVDSVGRVVVGFGVGVFEVLLLAFGAGRDVVILVDSRRGPSARGAAGQTDADQAAVHHHQHPEGVRETPQQSAPPTGAVHEDRCRGRHRDHLGVGDVGLDELRVHVLLRVPAASLKNIAVNIRRSHSHG